MDVALDVAKLLALLSVAALCVYLILVLARVREALESINGTIKDVGVHLTPVLTNVESVTAHLNNITADVEQQMTMVRSSVGALKTTADTIMQFEQDIQSRVEGPIRDLVAIVKATSRGVRTFMDRLTG